MALVTRSTDASIETTSAGRSNPIPNLPDLVAGEALTACAPCYIKSSDGKVYLSNATAKDEESEVIGFTGKAYASGEPVTLYPPGTMFHYGDDLSGDDSVSPGDVLFLATTNGRLSTTPTLGDPDGIAVAVDGEHIVFTRQRIGAGATADGAALLYTDTQLTAAQMNALAATNITLVAAPGAGLAVVPVAVHLFLDYGSAAFVQTNDTDQLALKYSGSAEIAEIGTQAQCVSFIEATADAALYSPIPAIAGGFVPEANKAVVLDNNGAAEYTTGTGSTVSVRVYYRVAPMAAFS